MNLPEVEYKKLKPKQLGGTKGKSESRKHIKVKRLVGSRVDKHIFEGECPDCGLNFFCMRKPKSKSLFKCKNCNFTSFIYKGYFSPDEYKVKPPKPKDVKGELWKSIYEYSGTNKKAFYGSKDFVIKNSNTWNQIEKPKKL